MRESLKRELDKSVPGDVTLSDVKKRQILKAAQETVGGRKVSRAPKLLPALAGVAVIGLAGVLGYPYVSDWQEPNASQEPETPLWQLEESLQQVTIPRSEESVMDNTIFYNDETGDFIFKEERAIYSYNVEDQSKTLLVEAGEESLIYEVAYEGEWLVWTEVQEMDWDNSTLNVRKLGSSETVSISDVNAMMPVIDGDHLGYVTFGSGGPTYRLMDLKTGEETILHQVSATADSYLEFNEGLLVASERSDLEGITELFIYDAKSGKMTAEFEVPSVAVSNTQVTHNKILIQFFDENFSGKLAVIDLETGTMSEIETPELGSSSLAAIYGNYVALSVPDGEGETIQLFELEGGALTGLPALDTIEEQLITPRFTDEGTLYLNGEAEDGTIYLLKVAD
ncbi:hypothetical protein [Planococcus sp. CAU13]|uniref:hypothetical protein n=1 Tax=Planococcus sp. CAU13 TaxID=1541197 RepID=UPI00052FDB2A|nr:hypothetical protein [Planococcus sp. CAU13]